MFEPSNMHFHLTKEYYGNQIPPPNSLWNFKSLDLLIQAGRTYRESTSSNNGTHYLELDHFEKIASRLELTNEQVFVLSKYLDEVLQNVWKNERELGTSNDVAYLSRWAPNSLGDQEIYTYMRIIPRALYGYSLYNIYVAQLGLNCTTLLEYFLHTQLVGADRAAICISDLWDFSKPVAWISWVSLFIEGEKGEAARDLKQLTIEDLSKFSHFFNPSNQFGRTLESVQQEIYLFYEFCHQPGRYACPDSDLVSGQLLQSRVTLRFPQFLSSGVKESPSILTSFQGIEKYLPINFKALEVEAQFDTKQDIDLDLASQAFFRASWLRNTTFYEQLFAENTRDDTHRDIKGFIRELIIQNRFKGGFFAKGVSEEQILEESGAFSKIDQAIIDYQQRAFEDYGIPELEDPESILSLLVKGNGLESEVMSGEDDIYRSRIFTKYGGSEDILTTRTFLDLETRKTQREESLSLWNDPIEFDSTDGFQINPYVDQVGSTVVYFPEIRRPVWLGFERTDELSDIELNVVNVPQNWHNYQTESHCFGNHVSSNSGVVFNVTKIWNTPAFVTKANFLDYKNTENVPQIRNQENQAIQGNRNTDDIEIWAEKHSGVVLKMSTHFMLSYEMGGDALCFNEQGTFLAPLLMMGRQIRFSDSQIEAKFPKLAKSQEHKKVLQLVFLILGGVFAGVGVVLLIRAALIRTHKIRFEEEEEEEIVVSM